MITKISPLLTHEITSFLTIECNNYFCTCKAASTLGKEVGKLVKSTLEKTLKLQQVFNKYNPLQTQKIVRFIARHVTFTCSAPRLYVKNDHLPFPLWTYNKDEILVSASEARHQEGATKVAYRCLNLKGEERCLLETAIKDSDVAKRYKKELAISRMVSGKEGFLTTYATFCRGSEKCIVQYMVQEFVLYDLVDFYNNDGWHELSFKQKIACFKTMAIALQFLHANKIVHGDIALQNILCDGYRVRLIDFETSSKSGENQDVYIGNFQYVPPDIVTPILKGDLKAQNALLNDFPNDIWRLGMAMGI